MAKVEFERRIEKAKRGQLRPVAEVKAVDVENPPPLYEIRWQTINVTSVVDGVSIFGKALVRLYHSEPDTVPGHFIGHHIHEKDLVGDVNDAQDQEINIAKKFYDSGQPAFWGIADPAAAI
ncbi:hypothetical protein E3T37_03690 [Cryobacterium sp. TMT2-10]|uniref:hypothetical protein n=1 Tax=Cryobacterium sp. TMT2-10 TaxID=1259244 RepID=UPI00106BD5C4|nr:hypothetical protein [Cryobacterium sp. TMT2-10]TFD41767.1 hypothetical protein E3T37_03690 [Cryobacterium sp. TMT2-10]